ncbi:pseudouridylate synthase [Nakamurella endophytica]|uniref:RNA pseudouridylate synthase n=1 Tax=Nakamurella endophytica TaxID=1748367 RepID=A0A917WG25_9ACTN|nr:pseudouridylate synthase [Nakamurella endophytica]
MRLPLDGPWTTVAEHLRERFAVDRERLDGKIAAGEVLLADGRPVTETLPFQPDEFVYLYRDPAPEPPVPFDVDVLHRDDGLLVVDKPHFLSTTPRGLHVTESVVVRLRRRYGLPELSPLHRLDRLTAGVLVLSLAPAQRGLYQTMFARREVTKSYLAVAPHRPDLDLPAVVRSRIVKERGTPVAREVPGEVNAVTRIERLAVRGDRALYRLRPETGRTHQLRVHLSRLGIPIEDDPFYPVLRDVDRQDWSAPLQLLAEEVAFVDPVSGLPRRFRTRRRLAGWPDEVPGV